MSENIGDITGVNKQATEEIMLSEKSVKLPPSAKRVYSVLRSSGPLTQKEIAHQSRLPARTVRYALDRLKGEDMLIERFYFKDTRQRLYSIKPTYMMVKMV